MASQTLASVLRYISRLADIKNSDQQTDSELLTRFVAQNDEAAFASLLHRHGPLVFGVCRQVLGNLHDAEDAFQATFLVLARKAASVRKQDSLAAWLYRVALNISRSCKSGNASRRWGARQMHVMAEKDLVDEVALREWQPLIHEEVDQLPEKYRVPILLCYFKGKTHDEAARELDWPIGTVKGRLARARDLLRTRLARRGVVLSAGAVASALVQSEVMGQAPATLVAHTLKGAVCFASVGVLPATIISAQAVALAKGALKTMTVTKVAHAIVVILAVGLLGLGAAFGFGLSHEAAPREAAAEKIRDVPERHAKGALPAWSAGAVLKRDKGGIFAVAFAPNGKTVVSGSGKFKDEWAGEATLWDAAKGKTEVMLEGHSGAIWALAVSPDGKSLATGCIDLDDDGIRLWDMATGKERAGLRSPEHRGITSLGFAPDGKTLASSSRSGNVKLWDWATGKERITLQADAPIYAFAFAPDGKSLAMGLGSGHVEIWDAATGKRLQSWQAYPSWVVALAFSADGKTLATASEDDTVIKLWDPATGRERAALRGHTEPVFCVTFAPDGKTLASGSADKTVRLWNLATEKEHATLQGHTKGVRALAFAPDGRTLVSASGERNISEAGEMILWQAQLRK